MLWSSFSQALPPDAEPPRTAVLSEIPLIGRSETSSGVDLTPPPPPRRLSLESSSPPTPVPTTWDVIPELRAGNNFNGFELVEELGQGAFARVFLARQKALAGRLVVLKISRRPTREAERLARLQHTNVVPVYSVHNDPPLQIICMPFLGRQTIADLLRQYRWHRSVASSSSSGPWNLLRRGRSTRWESQRTTATAAAAEETTPTVVSHAAIPEARDTFIGNPQAVLRLLSQLAAGLQHAHERGILHLDIKPANVLLAETGEPMLFDFNLAFDAHEQDRELIGGTIAYMAIEQLEDMRSRGQGQIDARTDLYALGVMAWEMLTGEVPFPAGPRGLADLDELIAARRAELPSLRQLNPAVTPAVEAILRKLLAPEPADRYQSAAELKTDIDRHLADLPLLHTPEPSLRERFQKWRRRNPRFLRRLTISACLLLTALTAGLTYHYLESQAIAAAQAKYRDLIPRMQSAHIELLVQGEYTWQEQGRLHAFAILHEYGLPYDPQWRERPDFRRLPPEEQQELSAALADLLLLVIQSRWEEDRWRPKDIQRQAAAELLELNRHAQQLYPPDSIPPLLIRQAQEMGEVLGTPTTTLPPLSSPVRFRDHYLEAASNILAGRFTQALGHLEPLIAQRPSDGLVHFWIAFCRQQLGQYDNALDRYDIASVLLPHDSRPLFFRGTIHSQKLHPSVAEREYSQAIYRTPDEPLYYRARGITRWRLRKYDEAEDDLDQALRLGGPDIQAHIYRAWIRKARGDDRGAQADLQMAFTLKPKSAGDHVARGLELMHTRPTAALNEFQAAEQMDPQSLVALFNQINVLGNLGQWNQAVKVSSRLVAKHPDYVMGWVSHAMVLAHLGQREEAHQSAQKALSLSQDVVVLFRISSVYALLAYKYYDDGEIAIDLLEKAFQAGFRRIEQVENSRLFLSLRSNPRYQQLLSSAKSLFKKN
jgi:serine/threonine protein kinase/Flp pilus assembly protein TadD